jgi:hypothetical protein
MAEVVFVFNEPEMAILTSWSGAPGRDFQRRLRTLETRARMSAGVQTGQLRGSIHTEQKTIARGLEGRVGSNVKHAKLHHEGTKAHVITPKRRGGSLRFVVRGVTVFAKRVHHPGARPNHYLTRWLREAIR